MEINQKNELYFVISLCLFIVTFLIISPYVHEMFHIFVAELCGCKYYILNFKLTLLGGLLASTKLLCYLPPEKYFFVLIAGSLSTFIIGNILIALAIYIHKKKNVVLLQMFFVSFGFILHSLLYFFEGEEYRLLFLMCGLERYSQLFPLIGTPLLLFYLYVMYRFVVIDAEQHISK